MNNQPMDVNVRCASHASGVTLHRTFNEDLIPRSSVDQSPYM